MKTEYEHSPADTRSEDPHIGRRESLIDLGAVFAASGALFLLEKTAQKLGWIQLPESATGLSAVIAGCIAAVAAVFLRKQKLRSLGFKKPERWALVPVWVVGIFGVFALVNYGMPPVIRIFIEFPSPDYSRYDYLFRNLPAVIGAALLLPLTASIPEEVIYRGFLLDRLIRITGSGKSGLVLAVGLQSVLFGAVHYQWGPGGMLLTTTMGAIWGTGFLLAKRNLWVVIMAHSLGHMVLVAQLYFVKGSALSLLFR